jgi:hypothetical protein
MADEKTIILGLEFDISELVSNSALVKKELDEIKRKRQELIDVGKEGTEEFQETEAAMRELTAQYKSLQKDIDNTSKARKSEAGSIDAMRAKLALLTKQYNAMSGEQRNNSKEGKALQKEILNLSNSLKKNEGAIGDNRRAVGGYTGSIKEAMGRLNLMPAAVGNVDSSLWQLAKNPITLTIMAIVGALALLFKAFTSTDDGALEVKARMEQLKTIFDVIIKRVAVFGEGLMDFLSGDFSEGAKKMGNAFNDIGDEIVKTTDAAYKYIKALDEIEDKQMAFVSQTAKNSLKMAQLENIAADKTKSVKERREAMKELMKISESELEFQKNINKRLYDEEIKHQAAKLGLRENDLRGIIESDTAQLGNYVKAGDEVQKKLEELFANSLNVERDYYNERTGNIKKFSTFENQINEDIKKGIDEVNKKKDEQIKKEQELLKAKQDTANQIKDSLLLEQQTISKANDLMFKERELKTKQQYADGLISKEQYEAELSQLQIDRLESEILNLESYAAVTEGEEDAIKEKKIERENLIVDAKLKGIQTVTDAQKKSDEDEANRLMEKFKKTEAFVSGVGDVFASSLDEQGLNMAKFQQNTLMFALNTLEKVLYAELVGKALTTTDSILSLGATGIARVAVIGGIIKGAFSIARAGLAANMPKAEKGMIIGGQPHSRGGTKFFGTDGTAFEAERGELLAVVNKRSTGLLNNLNMLNMAGGGNNFFAKGGLKHLADGGFALRGMSLPVEANVSNFNYILKAIQAMPTPIVPVESIVNATGNLMRIERKATI